MDQNILVARALEGNILLRLPSHKGGGAATFLYDIMRKRSPDNSC